MNRTLSTVAVTALVAGVAGGAIALAADGPDGSAAATPATVAPPVASAADLYRRDAPGVVVITADEASGQALGSGFVIDGKGDILTNDHVVSGATGLHVGFGAGASTYKAHVVGADASTDLAVIRLDQAPGSLHALAFDDSSHLSPGDPVYAIGNPFGLDRTMTAGIVSATGRDIQALNGLTIPNSIQTDAPINHGNSGGPLLDAAGHVVGVTSQIQGGTVDANVGIGFAVPSDTARTVAQQLISTGRASHPWLGIGLATIDPSAGGNLPSHGVMVTGLAPGSPAAGKVRAGDAIVAFDGQPVATSSQLADAVASHKPGDEVTLSLVRGGQARDVTVAVANAPAASGS